MDKPKNTCISCPQAKPCQDSAISWFFLFVGLIATIAIRVITLVLVFGEFWVKLAWYVGVAGFFIYFLYKFRQDINLRKALVDLKLAEKLTNHQPLAQADYEFLKSTICRIRSTKDTINYFFIFFSSGVVLILAIYEDFIRHLFLK
ncbi:MAG: hypothetical protein ABIG46_06045 [Candidatus Omnitrophota bacterium]